MRLIVVDHSINGPGGHYLAYANSLLDAARAAGFGTVLITGAGFIPGETLKHDLVCIYRYDFFGNRNKRGERRPKMPRNLLPLSNFGGVAKQAALKASAIGAAIVLGVVYYGPIAHATRSAKDIVRRVLRWLFIPQLYRRATGRSLREVWNYGRSRAHWAIQIVVGRIRAAPRRGRDTSAAFGSDTLTWLRDVCPGKDDLILFPTISFEDCAGLERILRKNARFKDAKWCLLFRRNLFAGDRSSYHVDLVASLMPLFARLAPLVTFFTDSDELGAQYRVAFGVNIHTLPIPHTKAELRRQEFGLPLCLSYVGDARTEKGFQLLPRLVDDCAADRLLRESVRFAIQSNYNVPRGEPACVVAKAQLYEFEHAKLELLDHALGREEYDLLLARSDVGLLLYKHDNYYARTSGVLIEYLSAGVPVLVPANTWLSAQFAGITADYQAEIVRHMKQLDIRTADLEAGRSDLVSVEFNSGAVDGGFLAVHVEGGEEGMYALDARLITYDQMQKRESTRALLYRAQGQAVGTRLLRLPGRVIKVQLRIPSSSVGSPRLRVSVRYLQAVGSPPPIGVVGLAYDSEADVIRCVREIVSHYSHYKASALAFSAQINNYHNPSQLIESLVAATKTAQT